MKRINRRLLAIVVSSAVALPMAALQADEMEVEPHSHPATYEHDHAMEDGSMSPMHAHEHESHPHADLHSHGNALYGSIRTGVIMTNPEGDGDETWNVGAIDGLYSRIGVRASHDIGGGNALGVWVEKDLNGFGTRVQEVTISGAFGTLGVGHQWTTYRLASSFDGSNYLGGNSNIGGARAEGIKYTSNLGGPFNFGAMVRDNGTAPGGGEGLDDVELSAMLDAGIANISVGYRDAEAANNANVEHVSVRVSGSAGPLDFAVGGGTVDVEAGASFRNLLKLDLDGDAKPDTTVPYPVDTDVDRFGFFLSYAVGDSGTAYFEYEDLSTDAGGVELDEDWVLLGYAHTLAPGVQVVAEYLMPDTPNVDSDTGIVALHVDF